MYSTRWTRGLRQGDVVGPIDYPKLKNPPQQVHKPAGWGGDPDISTLLEMPASERYAVVVSHDCDFTEAKRPQFLLARIQGFNPQLAVEQRSAIAAANDAVRVLGSETDSQQTEEADGGRYDYIDTFVLEPLAGCFDEDMLISFTTITAWPASMLETIVSMKKAELEHEQRVRLRKKLGFFFGREADDVDDGEKRDAPSA